MAIYVYFYCAAHNGPLVLSRAAFAGRRGANFDSLVSLWEMDVGHVNIFHNADGRRRGLQAWSSSFYPASGLNKSG